MSSSNASQEVLVVDDSTEVCRFLSRSLGEDNFRVTAMTDAAWVKEAVLERRPCLVILDRHLPGRDGLELLKEIKEFSPETPVVIISGDPDPAARDEARRRGATDFLSKPIPWNYLRNIAYLSVFLKESARA